MVDVVKYVIRGTKNMNALVKMDLYWKKIKQIVEKVRALNTFVCIFAPIVIFISIRNDVTSIIF